MSWMASNNAPLLGGQAVVDTSGFADQFRDGQKLRQEYEGRQQQKALNEIMKVGDHNGRLELAQQHKYAGALVPQLQKYEEDRQKSALDNLKTSADISKVYGETGKLGAETGEIGVKTQGQTIKNMTDKYSQISAGALTQNPQYFALMLGDFQNTGLINPDQKGAIIDMMMKDPASAAKVMQQLARGTIEGFKATAPEAKVLDGKDAAYMYSVNPYTGEANEPTQRVAYGQSPDNFATNETSRLNNQNTVAGSMYNSDNSLRGTQYSSDNSYNASVYGTDVASRDRGLKLNQDGQIAWAETAIKQQNANTNQVKAETAAQREQKAKAAMKPAVQTKFLESKNKAKSAYRQSQEITKWQKEIESGSFKLSGLRNAGNRASGALGLDAGSAAKYSEFSAFISAFVNEKMSNAAGTQTDSDEIRFWKEVTGTGGVPRTNEQALAMLSRLKGYSLNEQKTYYNDMRSIGNQYGMGIPEYGQSSGKAGSKPTGKTQKNQSNAGASIIGGILGGS